MDNTSNIHTLLVRFNTPVGLHELPFFRGAAIQLFSKGNNLFHNHIGGGDELRYSYPLIQYKRIGGKAAILFIGDAADSATDLSGTLNAEAQVGTRKVLLEVSDIEAHDTRVQIWNDGFRYTIRKYLPLNQHNYETFNSTESVAQRCLMLEKVLTGNILSFAKGVGIHFEDNVTVSILQIDDPILYMFKGVKMIGFDLEFSTNVSLPDHIGLGKGSSLGFGMIKRIK